MFQVAVIELTLLENNWKAHPADITNQQYLSVCAPCKFSSSAYYIRGQILELPLEILWPMPSFHLFSRALRKSLFPQYPLSSWRILTWKLAVSRQGRPGGTQGTGTGSAENHIWPHFIFYVQWTLQKYTATLQLG